MRRASDERRWWRRCWRAGLLAGMAMGLVGATFAAGLNDTGQTTCYDDTGPVSPEPSTHPRQDCTVGRDAAAAAGVLPKTGAGSKGFDYTKIANNGSVLPADATLGPGASQWACTRDNLTGLVWEVKTNDDGLRDMNWGYHWYDNIHTDNNGGNAGSLGPNTCGGTLPNSQCNTQAYIAAVNAAGLCGQYDWRMPMLRELHGLVDYSRYGSNHTIDSAYFPNNITAYWSSSTAPSVDYAWYIDFGYGFVRSINKNFGLGVMLMRGGQ